MFHIPRLTTPKGAQHLCRHARKAGSKGIRETLTYLVKQLAFEDEPLESG